MAIRIGLLITDDSDDHHAIAEAISHISEEIIVMNILDSQKALLLLKEGTFQPDYIFLDLSMHGIRTNTLLKCLQGNDGRLKMPVVVYGDQKSFDQIGDSRGLIFFSKDYQYSWLLEFLRNVFKPKLD